MIGIVCAFFHTEGKGFYSKPTLTITSENVGLVSDDTVVIKRENVDDDGKTHMSQMYAGEDRIDIANFVEHEDGTVTSVQGILIDQYGMHLDTGCANNEALSNLYLNGWKMLDYIHPVGSIYLAYNDSESPAEKFVVNGSRSLENSYIVLPVLPPEDRHSIVMYRLLDWIIKVDTYILHKEQQ